jgi:hypothetical protein
MPDDPKDTIEFAIRSAFVSYPKEDDPDWRSPHWITGKETAYWRWPSYWRRPEASLNFSDVRLSRRDSH